MATAQLSVDRAPAEGLAAPSGARTWPTTLALLALFGLLVGPALAWIYRPLLSGGFFLSDDHFLLREATAPGWRPWPADPWLLTGVRHEEMWRPLGLLAWRLSYLAGGASAPAFYLVDLALHLASAGLVLLLARRLGFGAIGSLVAGALFALHPIAVESVGWLAARFDLQATLFALVALHCHLAARRSGRWRAAELLAFAAALLSKESTIVLPLVALAVDVYLDRWPIGAARSSAGRAPRLAPAWPAPASGGGGAGEPDLAWAAPASGRASAGEPDLAWAAPSGRASASEPAPAPRLPGAAEQPDGTSAGEPAPVLAVPGAAGQPDGAGGGATLGLLVREASRLLRDAWPLWALAALYVPLRLALLGALGAYGDYLAPTPAGLLENLLHHSRMLLFVPYDLDAYVTPNLYRPPGLLSWRVLAPLAGALLLALLSPGVRLGLAVALVGLLPVLTISGGGRLVYFSLIGVALLAGALLSRPLSLWQRARVRASQMGGGLPASPRPRASGRPSGSPASPRPVLATLLTLAAAVALLTSYAQTARPRAVAWAEAGRLVRSLPSLARGLYPALPAGARLYVRGLPDHDREVYALRNVTALHFDVDAEPEAPPRLDAAAWASPRLAALLPVDDFPAALPPEEVCRAHFAQLERGGLSWQPVPFAPSAACRLLDDPLPATATPTAYRFGAALRLAAYALPSGPARPGETLRLDLLWQADAAPGRAYKTFVHVVGADGRPLAQRDAEPYDGRHPTAAWASGTTLHDRQPIALPADLPPGRYGLVVGWYGVDDPARLPAFDGDRPLGDAVRLATIEVGR